MSAIDKSQLHNMFSVDTSKDEIDRFDDQWLSHVHQEWLNQPKPTIAELFRIFPEAEETLQIKIDEEYAQLEEELRLIKEGIESDRKEDENTQWFLREMRRYFNWPAIQRSEQRILAYRRQLAIAHGVSTGEAGKITDTEINAAKRIPIEFLMQTKRSVNKRVYARCPFHDDRVPSFVIYQDTNTFHCFGCQAHGDSIDFIMRRDGASFREAVFALIGK